MGLTPCTDLLRAKQEAGSSTTGIVKSALETIRKNPLCITLPSSYPVFRCAQYQSTLKIPRTSADAYSNYTPCSVSSTGTKQTTSIQDYSILYIYCTSLLSGNVPKYSSFPSSLKSLNSGVISPPDWGSTPGVNFDGRLGCLIGTSGAFLNLKGRASLRTRSVLTPFGLMAGVGLADVSGYSEILPRRGFGLTGGRVAGWMLYGSSSGLTGWKCPLLRFASSDFSAARVWPPVACAVGDNTGRDWDW